jgi:ABC-type transport system substrate-binding protein
MSLIAAGVLPGVFHEGPDLVPVLDRNVVVSATMTSSAPQTVVYDINQKAIWADGVPLSAQDFIYNWQAQSGRAEFTDVGNRPFTPASTDGYRDIASVTSTAPQVVRVVFATPYPDWRSLFSRILPAHIARQIGFDSGFTDPVADLVSAGPYEVIESSPGQWVQLVRNPRYWGSPAGTASVRVDIGGSSAELADAVVDGELSCTTTTADTGLNAELTADSHLKVSDTPSANYLDLDLIETGTPFADLALRRAVVAAVDRTGLVGQTVAPVDPGAAPLDNRVFAAGTPAYRDNAPADGQPPPPPAPASSSRSNPADARPGSVVTGAPGPTSEPAATTVPAGGAGTSSTTASATTARPSTPASTGAGPTTRTPPAGVRELLAAAGYRFVGASLSKNGVPVTVRLGYPAGNPLAAAVARAVTADLAAIGIAVTEVAGNTSGRITGVNAAIEVRTLPLFPSGVDPIYLSAGADNRDGYRSAEMNSLIAEANTAPVGAPRQRLFNQIDSLAWQDAVDVPIVRIPTVLACQRTVSGVANTPAPDGIGWDIGSWAVTTAP